MSVIWACHIPAGSHSKLLLCRHSFMSCRWTLCASDRCFHRELLVPFFRAAKVLPVERGAGMFQPGLAAAEERLRSGDWVHIFPEGTRSRDGRMQPVRKGVGRLVAACAEADPVIVPFVHSGMREVLPKGSLLPKVNQEVSFSPTVLCSAAAAMSL
jgi:monolysocardiolipin acyltransferase